MPGKPKSPKRAAPATRRTLSVPAAAVLDFKIGDQVRLLEVFMGCPVGSEGKVTVVDDTTQSLAVQIRVDASCNPFPRLLRGVPMSCFDKNCHCTV